MSIKGLGQPRNGNAPPCPSTRSGRTGVLALRHAQAERAGPGAQRQRSPTPFDTLRANGLGQPRNGNAPPAPFDTLRPNGRGQPRNGNAPPAPFDTLRPNGLDPARNGNAPPRPSTRSGRTGWTRRATATLPHALRHAQAERAGPGAQRQRSLAPFHTLRPNGLGQPRNGNAPPAPFHTLRPNGGAGPSTRSGRTGWARRALRANGLGQAVRHAYTLSNGAPHSANHCSSRFSTGRCSATFWESSISSALSRCRVSTTGTKG